MASSGYGYGQYGQGPYDEPVYVREFVNNGPLLIGQSAQLQVTDTYSDGSVTAIAGGVWSSSDPDVVSITTDGLATSVTNGLATLTLTVDGYIVGSTLLKSGTGVSDVGTTDIGIQGDFFMATNPLVGGQLESEIARSYNSFAGADYRACIGQFQFAELQAVSYSITREKAPIYTMGSADPRAYSRNKRGIAGSLIWVNFDRHALLYLFYQARGKFVAQMDEIRPQYLDPDAVTGAAVFQASITRDLGPSIGAATQIQTLDDLTLSSVGGLSELASPWYSDQILPFDITLAASNEYGAMAGAKILGVEILNEGTGVSIDDTVTETQATFVARAVEPLQAVQSQFANIAGGQPQQQ